MDQLTLVQVLDMFKSAELADALYYANVPTTGTRAQRVGRLLDWAKQTSASTQDFFALFNADVLRGVCAEFDIRGKNKEALLSGLRARLGDVLALDDAARAFVGADDPKYLTPTRDEVVKRVGAIRLPSQKLRSEAAAQDAVSDALAETFRVVSCEYVIGGFQGWAIDIDIGNGEVGVEVKLAESVRAKTTEFHRMIGQAVHYNKRRYRGNLIVVVVGRSDELSDALFDEAFGILQELGITCVRLAAS